MCAVCTRQKTGESQVKFLGITSKMGAFTYVSELYRKKQSDGELCVCGRRGGPVFFVLCFGSADPKFGFCAACWGRPPNAAPDCCCGCACPPPPWRSAGRCAGAPSSSSQMREGSDTFLVHAYLPVEASFGLADEMRRRCSGAASVSLLLSHWERVEVGLGHRGRRARGVAHSPSRKGALEAKHKTSTLTT